MQSNTLEICGGSFVEMEGFIAEMWRLIAEMEWLIAEMWRLIAEMWRLIAEMWCQKTGGGCLHSGETVPLRIRKSEALIQI